MQQTEEIVDHLNDLLTRNYDAEKGYLEAAEKVSHTGLKDYMNKRAKNRYDFGHTLKDVIRGLGGNPDKGSSTKGDIHRAFISMKDALTSGDDAIFEECLRGEKEFVKEYREMMSHDNLPESLRAALSRQMNDAQMAIEELEAMKESVETS
jgi:uncharacterized protein (TIGR02284 family)